MGYPNYLDPRPDATKMANRLSRMSQWIDDHPANRRRSPLENLMLRTSVKMHEERGEVNAALIGMSGQNPRKGVTHSIDDVESELLDWAVVALGGVEHIHGNDGSSMARLAAKLVKIHDRMEAKRTEAARLTLDEFKTAEPMVDLNAETERVKATLTEEEQVRLDEFRAASSTNWPEVDFTLTQALGPMEAVRVQEFFEKFVKEEPAEFKRARAADWPDEPDGINRRQGAHPEGLDDL